MHSGARETQEAGLCGLCPDSGGPMAPRDLPAGGFF